MTGLRPLVLATGAWIALASCGLTAAGAVATPAPPIRLLAPVEGVALVAGGTAELAWEELPSFAALDRAEEWEAFLSLDGGATYPVRLTPHLDQDVRRFHWEVPAVATGEARLLLRFGDEHRETAVPLAQRFVIAAPAVPPPLGDAAFALGRRSAHPAGESALPGQHGVVVWVDGTRRGDGLRHRAATDPSGIAPAHAFPESPLSTDMEGSEEAPLDAAVAKAATSEELPRAATAPAAAVAPPRPGGNLLLLTQRRNE